MLEPKFNVSSSETVLRKEENLEKAGKTQLQKGLAGMPSQQQSNSVNSLQQSSLLTTVGRFSYLTHYVADRSKKLH